MYSAVIITKNEESRIADCISSIVDVVEEIVLIDGESTDGTLEVASALSPKVKVFTKPWSGYGSARNYGAKKASHPWIISIDADERSTSSLNANLLSLHPEENSIYTVRRVQYYRDQPIRYGWLAPETKDKIYHRAYYKWDDTLVHESLIPISSAGLHREHISGSLHHVITSDLDSLLEKQYSYARLAAREWLKKDRSPSVLEQAISPTFHFLRNYLIKGGFLSGSLGWALADIARQYHAEKYRAYRKLVKDPSYKL